MGRLHTGDSSSASTVAAAPSIPPWGRCGAQIEQHGAVRSGIALPEHAQAPEPEPQGSRHAPAGDSHMDGRSCCGTSPQRSSGGSRPSQPRLAQGSSCQQAQCLQQVGQNLAPATSRAAQRLRAAAGTWPQQLPHTAQVPFVWHPWKRLGSGGYTMPRAAAVRLQREVRQDLRVSGPSGAQHKLVQTGQLQAAPDKV